MRVLKIVFIFTLLFSSTQIDANYQVDDEGEPKECSFDMVTLESKEEGSISKIKFSDDSKNIAYILRGEDDNKIILNGMNLGTYQFVADIKFIKGTNKLSYAAKTLDGKYILVRDGKVTHIPHDDVSGFVFSEQDDSYAYVVDVKSKIDKIQKVYDFHESDYGSFVVINGMEQDYVFDSIKNLKFIGGEVVYSGVTDKGKSSVSRIYYKNEFIGPIQGDVWNFEYSEYTKKFSYLGGVSNSEVITVNGKEIEKKDYISKIFVSQEDDSYILLGNSISGDEINTKSVVYYIDSLGQKKIIYEGDYYTIAHGIASRDLKMIYFSLGISSLDIGIVYNNGEIYQTASQEGVYIYEYEPGLYELWTGFRAGIFSEKNGRVDSSYDIENLGNVFRISSVNSKQIYFLSYNRNSDMREISSIYIQNCGDNLGKYLQTKAVLNNNRDTRKYVSQIDILMQKLPEEKKQKLLEKVSKILEIKPDLPEKTANILKYIKYSGEIQNLQK